MPGRGDGPTKRNKYYRQAWCAYVCLCVCLRVRTSVHIRLAMCACVYLIPVQNAIVCQSVCFCVCFACVCVLIRQCEGLRQNRVSLSPLSLL